MPLPDHDYRSTEVCWLTGCSKVHAGGPSGLCKDHIEELREATFTEREAAGLPRQLGPQATARIAATTGRVS